MGNQDDIWMYNDEELCNDLLEYPSKLYISWLTDNDLGIFSINWCYIFTYISDVFTSCDIRLIQIFISCSHLIFIFKTEIQLF